ncbi:Hypothetical predicted protein [Lecanosticta acicola]|uniref:Uncharacterized protein n=1 Tax=Lecanosticta acicola TaxID=111012 RepID=A0AAI9E8N1_9PEZI|nr:Hypothetical predicted protein [Lecanosticta acicola]
MNFTKLSSRRKSDSSSLSTQSSTSSIDLTLASTTLPLAPREDDYNMSEETRQKTLLAKCKRANKEPWKSAKALPSRD